MRYAVVIEKAEANYSAYVPDSSGLRGLPERLSRTSRRKSARQSAFHIEGLQADGIAVPQPTSIAEYVET